MTERWCIVGAGMLGLTLAHRLAAAGRAVTVLEAAPALGGLAGAWSLGSVRWDRFYHVTLLSDLHLRGLLRELDLDGEMVWKKTRTGFFADGALYPLDNALDYLKFPPLGLIDKMRLAGTILYAARIENGLKLERVPVADWLTKLSGRRTFERIWQPLLRAKLGENYKRASAAFIWAVIRRLYAARRSGMKTEMFGYLPGGYGRMLDRFAGRLAEEGVRLVTGTPVERIERQGGQLRVVAGAATEVFDRVAVTLPGPLASRLVPGLDPAEHAAQRNLLYQGIVCASLLLRRPLAGCYLTYITDPEVPFTAVVEMSSLVDRQELGGNHLVYLPKYLVADDPFFRLSDAEIEQRFVAGLQRIHPDFRAEDILAVRIARAPHVLAVATLDYSRSLPAMETSIPGLSIVNSAHIVNGTLNVNETVALADAAARRLMAAGADTASGTQDIAA